MIPNDPKSLPESVETMPDIIGNEGFLLDNPLWTTLKVLLSVLILFTVFFLVLFLYRWLKRFFQKRKELPPDQKALKALKNITSFQNDQSYYINLTEILRDYISDHLKIDIKEKTSEEILAQRELPSFGNLDFQTWQGFWERSQSVVFGHFPVEGSQREEDYGTVKIFVENSQEKKT